MAKEINTNITINAERNKVWEILTDFKRYPEWNPFIMKAQGCLKDGEKLTIELDGMKFSPIIVEFVEEKKLTWFGQFILPKLFDGRHNFELQALDNGYTKFIHQEKFTGILPFFLGKNFFSKIELDFEKMNLALKERCED